MELQLYKFRFELKYRVEVNAAPLNFDIRSGGYASKPNYDITWNLVRWI